MTPPRLQYGLATPDWDERLGQVAAEPVPGRICVAYEHQPSFLDSLSVLGNQSQAIVGHQGGTVVGLGVRSTRQQYLDGRPHRLGYLSALRIRPAFRSGLALARGYAFLRRLHEEDPVSGYLSTIIATNATARQLLESGRAALPRYQDCGGYTTYVLGGRRQSASPRIRTATIADVPRLFNFLQHAGTRRQGFPVLAPEDLGSLRLRGLRLQDFLVAERAGECLGCIAGWDQTSFRQHRIVGYAKALRWLRPMANPVLTAMGYPKLPPPGHVFSALCASFFAVRDDQPELAAALLGALRDRVAREHRHHLSLGLHERDPLTPILRRVPAIRYQARLYAVAWDNPEPFARHFQPPHVPHLELGML